MFGILMFGVAFTRRLAYRVQSDTHPALEHTRRSGPKVWRQVRSIQSRLPSMHGHEQKQRQQLPNRFPSPGVSLIHWHGYSHLGNSHLQDRVQQMKALFLRSQVLHMFLIHGENVASTQMPARRNSRMKRHRRRTESCIRASLSKTKKSIPHISPHISWRREPPLGYTPNAPDQKRV